MALKVKSISTDIVANTATLILGDVLDPYPEVTISTKLITPDNYTQVQIKRQLKKVAKDILREAAQIL